MTFVTINLNKNKKYLPEIRRIIRRHLEQKKRQIAQEILHYPPPIPACDVQFNFLLEERARVGQVLGKLDSWSDLSPVDEKQVDWLTALLAATPELDEEIAQAMQSTA